MKNKNLLTVQQHQENLNKLKRRIEGQKEMILELILSNSRKDERLWEIQSELKNMEKNVRILQIQITVANEKGMTSFDGDTFLLD